MPPDDDLFPSGGEGLPTPPQGGNGAGDPAAGGSEPLTKADIAAYVNQFVEPNTEQMQRITQNQTELANTIGELKSVLERLGVAAPEGSGEPLDPATLLTDPNALKGVVGEEVTRLFKEQVAPILSQGIEARHQQTVREMRDEINSTYGEGVWEKEFAPELDPLFDRTRKEAPTRLGDVEAIRKSIQVIKGEKIEKLTEAKQAQDTARAEAEEKRRQEGLDFVKSNLSGGIGMPTDKATLSDEAKDMLERIWKATGTRPDPDEFLKSLNSGPTLADYRARQSGEK